ncbi:MAG: CDP-alcohol phosphatidyltransferase family protein [Bacteroidetes bacterium]|nr:CDP-alcohol phosphatidyltransferase family protein [Bacteroidota bacterium]
MKNNIPNAITCCNLLCGCLAVIKIFDGELVAVSYLVGMAAIFDFLDGFVARLINAQSVIGKDLDSLADLITFGLVPGLMVFKILNIMAIGLSAIKNISEFNILGTLETFNSKPIWYSYFALLIPIFSAIRLAKFNNDTRQSESFIGLPTPANAIFFCSIPLCLNFENKIEVFNLISSNNLNITTCIYILLGLVVLFSYLLVSPLNLLSLKFKTFNFKDNLQRYILLISSLLLLLILKIFALPLIVILYVFISIIFRTKASKKANIHV